MDWEHLRVCNFCGRTEFTNLETDHLLFKEKVSLSECEYCGLIFINPRPNLEQYYRLFMDGTMGRKAFQMLFLEKTSYKGLFEKLREQNPEAETLFDMGCGLGLLLKEASLKGFKTAGNDVNYYNVEYAFNQGLDVVLGPSHLLLQVENSYDIVVMKSYLAHSPQPFGDIQLAYKMLRPNGLLFIREALISNLKDGLNEEIELDHFTFLKLRTLTSMLWSAGFSSVEVEHIRPFRKIYTDKVDVYARKP